MTRRAGGSRARYVKHVPGSIKPLSRAEEQRLFRAWRDQGDRQARETLIRANLRFVHQIAMQLTHPGLTYDQRFSAGQDGLLTAFDRFDPDRGTKFISWAVWWIRQAIEAAIRRTAVVSGIGMHHELYRRRRCLGRLEQEHGRTVSEDEVAAALDWQPERRRLAALALAAGDPAWLDDPIDERWNAPSLVEHTASPDPGPEELMAHTEMVEVLTDLVEQLPDRERLAVKMHFGLDGQGGDYHLGEIAARLGVSNEWARQLIAKGVERLRQAAAATDGPYGRLAELW